MYSISVETNWDYKTASGIRLMPDFNPVTVTLSTDYDSQGRCDYDKMISGIENTTNAAWKMEIDLRRQAKVPGGIEGFLKEIMLEGHAWNQPDVLGEFSLTSARSGGNGENLSLALKMNGSDYRFNLWTVHPV